MLDTRPFHVPSNAVLVTHIPHHVMHRSRAKAAIGFSYSDDIEEESGFLEPEEEKAFSSESEYGQCTNGMLKMLFVWYTVCILCYTVWNVLWEISIALDYNYDEPTSVISLHPSTIICMSQYQFFHTHTHTHTPQKLTWMWISSPRVRWTD